ncbi:SixA phosphatase family protein [Pseudonocardia sp. CA-107938]|uniref:SixA phosphatase family protein n=1 Tax=Pseudonocardia sp. CA-107938 TaxID=3240021 RepID=UPI003D947F71
MRRLVLLRHAKSEWPEGIADRDRPLAARGRREAPLAGKWLHEHLGSVDLVVCSPARRARETCAAVNEQLGAEVRVDGRLYPGFPDDLVAVARELPDAARTVLFIAHNPGLEELVGELAGAVCVLKTSSIAVLSGDGGWPDVGPGWATLDAATPRA